MQGVNGLEIGPEVGACGSAAFRNETTISKTSPTITVWRCPRFCLELRAARLLERPHPRFNQKVLGTFAMYHKHPAAPHDRDLRVVKAGAHLAGNAIERLRAEEKLRENAERIAMAEKAAAFGIWQTDIPRKC